MGETVCYEMSSDSTPKGLKSKAAGATASSGSRIPSLAIYSARSGVNELRPVWWSRDGQKPKNSAPSAVGGVQLPASAAQGMVAPRRWYDL